MSNRYAIIAGLFTLAFSIVIYKSLGFYYEFYEVFNNYLNNLAVGSKGVVQPLSNETFVLRQVYMAIQKAFPGTSVNSWGYLFFMLSGLWAIAFGLLYLVRNRFLAWPLIGSVFLLYAENLVKINTSRISFTLAIGAILLLLVYRESRQRKYLFMFFALVVSAVFNRVETSAVAFFLATMAFLFDPARRNMIRYPLYAFLFSLFCFGFFVWYNATFCSYVYNFSAVERKVIHHQNFIYDRGEMLEIIEGKVADSTKLVHMANTFFLLDEPLLDDEVAPTLLKYRSFADYLRHNREQFIQSFTLNMLTLLTYLLKYILVYVLMLFLLAVWLASLIRKGRPAWRILLVSMGFFFLPFLVSVNANISERFFAPYTFLMFTALLVGFVNSNQTGSKIRGIAMTASLLITAIHFAMFVQRDVPPLHQTEKFYQAILTDYNQETQAGNNPVFLSLMSVAALPAKLFDPLGSPEHGYRMVNHCILDHTGFLRNKNRGIYGEDYRSLIARMRHTAENSRYLYANPYAVSFLQAYMRHIYGYEYPLTIMETYEPLQNHRLIKIFKYEIAGQTD